MSAYANSSNVSTLEDDTEFIQYVINSFKEYLVFGIRITSEKIIKLMIESGDQTTLHNLATYTFSQPHTEKMHDLLKLLIEKGDQNTLQTLATFTFSQPHTEKMHDLLKLLIEKGDQTTLHNLARYTFSQPHTEKMHDLLKLLIEKGDQTILQTLATYTFSQPHTEKMHDLLKLLIEKGDQPTLQTLAEITFSKPHIEKMHDLLKLLIEKGDQTTLQYLATYTFSQPHTEQMHELFKLLIEKGDQTTLQNLARNTFSKPHWQKARYQYLNEAISIEDRAQRKAFLDQHSPKTVVVQKTIEKMPEYKKITTLLTAGEVVKTDNGKTLTIASIIGEGKRGKVFKVIDENKKEFALKVAINQSPETLESMKKEESKAKSYDKYKIPHAKIIESNSQYALKDLIVGVQADQWVKDWEKNGFPKDTPEVIDLKKLIESTSKNGVYVGDLNRKNLIWDGKHWIVIDSGEISEGVSAKESLDRFLEKIPNRWSKSDDGDKCQLLFKNLAKELAN
jgi:chemotaxis regulatin CheY-phosphate phosphatase CheZ